ncbi:MAG TPA: hypothetical protein VG474_10740 [Solirubrobacteraceae bacterium]|nr:hypothetical protein [Solirubrobacteraceae bacterium]
MRGLVIGAIVCVVGCAVLLALDASEIVTAAGLALGGIAVVLAISAVFYAVGRSEDRERAAREGRAAGPPA